MFLPFPHNRPIDSSVILGSNTKTDKDITITEEERLRSISVVGATGTGKSTLLKSMAIQAVKNGESLIYIDVDDRSIRDLLVRIPQERMKDVIYLDFSDRRRFLGINYTAADRDIERAIELFKRLWDIGPHTPNLENTLRASLLTLQYNNVTIDRMPDLLSNKEFRASCMARIPDTIDAFFVRDFWENDFNLRYIQKELNLADSTLNKIRQMCMDKYIAYIIAQIRNTLHIRKDILDTKKILLIHLSKKDLQPERVRRIGAMILEELKFALFSRDDLPQLDIVNLICDEWQLYLTPDFFEDVLSQGRRYGVSTVLATQTIENFDNKLQAILDQVGTHITFAVGVKDAIKLAPFYAKDPPPELKYEHIYEPEIFTYTKEKIEWDSKQLEEEYHRVEKELAEIEEILFVSRKYLSSYDYYKELPEALELAILKSIFDLGDIDFGVPETVERNCTPDLQMCTPIEKRLQMLLQENKETDELFARINGSFFPAIEMQREKVPETLYPPQENFFDRFSDIIPDSLRRFTHPPQEPKEHETVYIPRVIPLTEYEKKEVRAYLQYLASMLPPMLHRSRVYSFVPEIGTLSDEEVYKPKTLPVLPPPPTSIEGKMRYFEDYRATIAQVSYWQQEHYGVGIKGMARGNDGTTVLGYFYPKVLVNAKELYVHGERPDVLERFQTDREKLLVSLGYVRVEGGYWRPARFPDVFSFAMKEGEKLERTLMEKWDVVEREKAALGAQLTKLRNRREELLKHRTVTREPVTEYKSLTLNTGEVVQPYYKQKVETQTRLRVGIGFSEGESMSASYRGGSIGESHGKSISISESEKDIPLFRGKEGTTRTYTDLEKAKAKELLQDMPDGIAYVAMRMRGGRFQPRMKTHNLDEKYPIHGSLEKWKAKALENAIPYTTEARTIDQDFWKRRQRFGIASSPVMQTPQEEKRHDAPVPLQVAKRRVYTANDNNSLPTLTFGDNYLKLFYHFHYLTRKQVCRLLGKSENAVQTALVREYNNGLLQRKEITGITKAGNVPFVYWLTQKGIDYLEEMFGVSAGTRKGTFSEHTLRVNDALISLVLAAKQEPLIRLVGLKHERSFKQHNIQVGDKSFLEPDGFLHFQLGSENEHVGICLEIDLGSETREQWQEKVEKYMSFAGGVYQKQFGLESLTIAVCRPSGNVRELARWTKEAVKDKKEYSSLFLFTNLNPTDCDSVEWVTSPVWTSIDNTPYALIEKLNPVSLKKEEEISQRQAGILHLVKQEEPIQPVPEVPQPQQKVPETTLKQQHSTPLSPAQPQQPISASRSQVRPAIAALTYDRYDRLRKKGLIDLNTSYGEWLNHEVNKILEEGENK